MTETDVNQVPVSEGAASEGVTTQPKAVHEEHLPPAPGSKTESALLLESLHEERAKRRELEAQVENLTSSVPSDTEDLTALRNQLASVQAKQAKTEVLETYPQLKEMWQDFEQFRDDPDNKGMNLRTAAKSFMVEKGLLEPQRKGLEKPTGGTRTPTPTGMSMEDVKHLRETNFRKYSEMVQNGQIKFAE